MSYTPRFPANAWSPGHIRRLPWLGLGALVGAILALGASVAILVVSNGQPISSWTIQPSVYIAIAVPIVNLLLAFALGEGVDIAFWRRATTSGTTVGDLHRIWHHGKSFKGALLAGRHTGLIAIACILVVAAEINSPLFQRASKVIESSRAQQTTLELRSAPNIPGTYYTGYQSGRGGGISTAALYYATYLPLVNDWLANTSYSISNHGCTGTCRTRMQGLGLSINCSTSSADFNLSPQYQANGVYDVSKDPSVNGTYIFGALVADSYPSGALMFTSMYKDTFNCNGTLNIQQCLLQTATVEYPVLVDGNKSTISLDPDSTIWGDNVLNVSNTVLSTMTGPQPGTGILLALFNRFNSSAHMRWVGAAGYEIKTVGPTAQSYAKLNTDGKGPAYFAATDCSLAFRNPMDDMIAGARDLVFRTGLAIAEANSTWAQTQSLQADEVVTRAVFHSNYAYIGAAVAVSLLTMIPVVLVFRGYSEFGRPCSLSPIAVAHAFDAPLLRARDSNLPVDELVNEVGKRSVKYGAVRVDAVHSGSSLTGYKEGAYVGAHEVGEVFRLCMADEDVVREPRRGEIFTG